MSKPILHMPADFMQRPPMLRLYDGPCRGDAVTMFHDLAGSCALGRQDGIVLRGATKRLGLHACAASELVRVGLWAQNDEGDYVIVDWLEIFPPARIKARREADAIRKARERTTARELKPLATKGAKGREHAPACVQPSAAASRYPMAIVTESRCDSVTFAAARRDIVIDEPVTETRQHTLQPRTASAESTRDVLAPSDVSWTQPKDTVTPAVQLSDEELFGISGEVGTDVALKDLNLKNKNNSSTPPPQPSSIRIENVAAQTNAKTGASPSRRRPAARRTASDADLWLPFDAVQPKPVAPDMSAARGAALIFEATSMQHAPFAKKNRESCEWLSERPAKEWAIAKPVLAAEANKIEVRSMLTPEHIAGHWATHYAVGIAPRGRGELERKRASLKPFRAGFVGPSPVHTDAEYAAEYAAARAGTLGASC